MRCVMGESLEVSELQAFEYQGPVKFLMTPEDPGRHSAQRGARFLTTRSESREGRVAREKQSE